MVREQEADPGSAFPGHGMMKPEQQEIERLRAATTRSPRSFERARTIDAGLRPASILNHNLTRTGTRQIQSKTETLYSTSEHSHRPKRLYTDLRVRVDRSCETKWSKTAQWSERRMRMAIKRRRNPRRNYAISAVSPHSHSIVYCRHIALISFIKIISSDLYTVMHTVRNRHS